MVIVGHLWKLHRDELASIPRERLAKLLSDDVLGEHASNHLRFCLASFDGDEEYLKAVWTKKAPGHKTWGDAYALMDAFAHVRTKDQAIVGDIIDIFDTEEQFGCKLKAMISLGKIGPVAGTRASATIRRVVYDSEPQIIAIRDRVLERLESDEDGWKIIMVL
ncbi:MAG: hypothetical protein ABIY70_16605 [Capsulimonas sp.]|uniref:hypothetical protein n=1 Tax=Capsulimonas sp. TaxID=2494211 RepID=UPI003266D4B0